MTTSSKPAFLDVVVIAIIAGVCLELVAEATFTGAIAQDWFPFQIAARLASEGRWSDIYPLPGAINLFDVPAVFRALGADHVTSSGALALPDQALTTFVSPPPAAFLLAPLSGLSWANAVVLSRLALAVPMAIAMIGFATLECRSPRSRMQWSLLCLSASPLWSYALSVGQPSAWLLPAVIGSVSQTRWLQILGGIALGLVVITKATPLVVVVGLLILGPRTVGGVALAVAATLVAVTWPQSGFEAWNRFSSISGYLSGVVVTDWNNASIDAEVHRVTTGQAVPSFVAPTVAAASGVIGLKLAAIGALTWSALRRARRTHRISALWIAWLLVSPVVWLHYFITLVPLAATVKPPLYPIACVSLMTLTIWMRSTGFSPITVGHFATLSLVVTAGCVLWLEENGTS